MHVPKSNTENVCTSHFEVTALGIRASSMLDLNWQLFHSEQSKRHWYATRVFGMCYMGHWAKR